MSGILSSRLLLLLIWLSAMVSGSLSVVLHDLEHLHDENGIFESGQVALLCIGALGYWWLAVAGVMETRLVHGTLGLLCISFVLRELDVEHLSVPELVKLLGSGIGRNLLLLCLWVWLAGLYCRLIPNKVAFVKDFCRSRTGIAVLVCGTLLILSALLDRGYLPLPHLRLLEELVEIHAYLMLVLPALARAKSRLLEVRTDASDCAY